MNNGVQVCSAVDAVRCFYLAGMARREGHEEAARRLHAKAAEGVSRFLATAEGHQAKAARPLAVCEKPCTAKEKRQAK